MDVMLAEINEQLKKKGTSLEQVELMYPKIAESFMPLSITGVSARTYLHWKNQGLIPNSSSNENSNEGQREWVRLNLFDFVWLKIIQVMRDFGIPIKTIKETKDLLFTDFVTDLVNDKEEYLRFLKEDSDTAIEDIISTEKAIDLLKATIGNNPEEYEPFTTVIGSMVTNLFLLNDKGSVIINKDKGEFDIDFFTYKTMDDFKMHILPLLDRPHIQIPIRKLIEDFFDDPKSEKFVEGYELLNLKERKVIKAIRQKDFKEIVIKRDDKNESIIIEIERDGELLDQKARDVRRVLGLNDYSEVTIKYRNDKHMYFKNKTRI